MHRSYKEGLYIGELFQNHYVYEKELSFLLMVIISRYDYLKEDLYKEILTEESALVYRLLYVYLIHKNDTKVINYVAENLLKPKPAGFFYSLVFITQNKELFDLVLTSIKTKPLNNYKRRLIVETCSLLNQDQLLDIIVNMRLSPKWAEYEPMLIKLFGFDNIDQVIKHIKKDHDVKLIHNYESYIQMKQYL